jgi:phospho-N-acetylmuramoyl-pentapeptide-transferase
MARKEQFRMIALILAIAFALLSSLFLTPLLVRYLVKHELGQFIRQDGPQTHLVKRGTPTMGGLVIVISTLLGYGVAAFWMFYSSGFTRHPTYSSLLALGLMVAMGAVGFVDDFAKIRMQQSLGLTPAIKIILQGIIGVAFAVLCMSFPNERGILPTNIGINTFGHFEFNFALLGDVVAVILFIIWINLIITAWTNAVNLTDGLDGLATGVSLFAFLAYVVICFWQFINSCATAADSASICYTVRDPWDLTLVAGAVAGACFGFLWWNASPAKIFMGDTGSLALGGIFAALSILSRTEVLAMLIGGVFVLECISDIIQVGYFKMTRKRVFKMAPIHHHFELKGWTEVNVVIRFWIISALCAVAGIAIFYASWLQGVHFD